MRRIREEPPEAQEEQFDFSPIERSLHDDLSKWKNARDDEKRLHAEARIQETIDGVPARYRPQLRELFDRVGAKLSIDILFLKARLYDCLLAGRSRRPSTGQAYTGAN